MIRSISIIILMGAFTISVFSKSIQSAAGVVFEGACIHSFVFEGACTHILVFGHTCTQTLVQKKHNPYFGAKQTPHPIVYRNNKKPHKKLSTEPC